VKVKVYFNKTAPEEADPATGVAAGAEFEHPGPAVSNRSLADVVVGTAAIVEKVGGRRDIAIRLMEMGLLPGTRVEVLRVAPLGDPIELRVRGFALSIRRSEARKVEVRGDAP
jgi:Fe2+ transport system protein FeoA